jgi:RNA polymerase sigma-70 factor, ECF subfamily
VSYTLRCNRVPIRVEPRGGSNPPARPHASHARATHTVAAPSADQSSARDLVCLADTANSARFICESDSLAASMSASHHPQPIPNSPSQPALAADESLGESFVPAPVNDVVWADESAVYALRAWRTPADDAELPPNAECLTDPAAMLGSEQVGDVFCAYRSYVAKIGRRILGSGSEIDDLIQDVFMATLKDIHKVKDPARLRAWLATVTTRIAKRRRFRTSLRPTLSHDDAAELDLAEEDVPSPESTADLAGNIQRVLSLPDELRTPWLLKHVEGHTLQDVATQCDCSLSTAARRIQTATGKIRRR